MTLAAQARQAARSAGPFVRGDPLGAGLALTGVLVLAVAVRLACGTGTARDGALLTDAAAIAVGSAVAIVAWRASALAAIDSRYRRGWRLMSIAMITYVIASVLVLWNDALQLPPATVAPADVAYLAAYVVALAGVIAMPGAIRSSSERTQFALDALSVLIASGFVIWYLIVYPAATAIASDAASAAMAVVYPAIDALMLTALVLVWLRRPDEGGRRAVTVLTIGLGIVAIGNLVYAELAAHGAYASGDVSDVLQLVGVYVVGFAPQYHFLRARHVTDTVPARVQPAPSYRAWPYLAVAVTYLLLVLQTGATLETATGWLLLAVALLTTLSVARQFLAAREIGRLHAQLAGERVAARFRSLVQNSSDLILVVDGDATIRYAAPSVDTTLGITDRAIEGQLLGPLLHPDDERRARDLIASVAAGGGSSEPQQWRIRHRDGSWLHMETIATDLLDDPNVGGILLNARDVTDRQALEDQLAHQALHDGLTGLPNRALFIDRLKQALARTGQRKGRLAVLCLDLDDFQTVNDSLGHPAGDGILAEIASRLRSIAGAGDTVARLAGDEFAILLEDVRDVADAIGASEIARREIQRPIGRAGGHAVITASVGIATSTGGDEQATDLLRNADVAMYMARAAGRGSAEVYEPGMRHAVRQRLELGAELHRAVERREFVVYFQPIVELATAGILGAEALVRWRHPTRGLIAPDGFIPLAEESGLIVPLGQLVLEEACRKAATWRPASGRATPPYVTVNLSVRQLADAALPQMVSDTLGTSGLEPARLTLEMTESVLMSESDASMARLAELRALGASLSIDDFGTGYSSLSYLGRLPITGLKIPRPFVERLGPAGEGDALARAIVSLADALRLSVVAEGIETEAQAEALRVIGCRQGQGFLFARPMPHDSFLETLIAGA